jgi:hypothetical protein
MDPRPNNEEYLLPGILAWSRGRDRAKPSDRPARPSDLCHDSGSVVHFRIFARHGEASVDLGRRLQNAARAFEPDVRVQRIDRGQLAGRFCAGVRVAMNSPRDDWTASFELRVRHATAVDLAAAREADARSQHFGMSLLAENCSLIWELEPAPQAQQKPVELMVALAASAALGPVLSEDGSELFGVRTALERARTLSSLAVRG